MQKVYISHTKLGHPREAKKSNTHVIAIKTLSRGVFSMQGGEFYNKWKIEYFG